MNLEELKEKFIKKINDEYDSFVKELKKQEAEVIIDMDCQHFFATL